MNLIKAAFHALLDMPEWFIEKLLGRFGNIDRDQVERWGGRACFGIVVIAAVAVTLLAL
jgi:hypothetical protein